MGFGVGIVLLVLGLILVTGAVDLPASVDDVVATTTVGWILLLAGVARHRARPDRHAARLAHDGRRGAARDV